jgi:hypothetical protein
MINMIIDPSKTPIVPVIRDMSPGSQIKKLGVLKSFISRGTNVIQAMII